MSATTASRRRYKARIAPRKARGPGPASRIQWDRVGRIVLVLVLFAVLASYVNPTIDLFRTWRDAGAAEQRLAELQAENDRLERRAAELKTPAAALREARKLGMVGAGEQGYVIKGLR
ncbi:MAG: septum formation initiator family protein [Solirubrobacterales bacterium]